MKFCKQLDGLLIYFHTHRDAEKHLRHTLSHTQGYKQNGTHANHQALCIHTCTQCLALSVSYHPHLQAKHSNYLFVSHMFTHPLWILFLSHTHSIPMLPKHDICKNINKTKSLWLHQRPHEASKILVDG